MSYKIVTPFRKLRAKGYGLEETKKFKNDYISRMVHENPSIYIIPSIKFENCFFQKLDNDVSNMKSKMDENSIFSLSFSEYEHRWE